MLSTNRRSAWVALAVLTLLAAWLLRDGFGPGRVLVDHSSLSQSAPWASHLEVPAPADAEAGGSLLDEILQDRRLGRVIGPLDPSPAQNEDRPLVIDGKVVVGWSRMAPEQA